MPPDLLLLRDLEPPMDDRPCGYEGRLTDQFGLLEAIFARWGRRGKAGQ